MLPCLVIVAEATCGLSVVSYGNVLGGAAKAEADLPVLLLISSEGVVSVDGECSGSAVG